MKTFFAKGGLLLATTTLLPIRAGKGRTISAALGRSTDYVKNPEKTNGGEWISAYECDPISVSQEFLFTKSHYATITGRDYGKHDVIAYHLRQSFKPGEVDPATANRISYELAMKLTKGRHAFICCTHADKAHVHSHVIFNSTTLDHGRKFRNSYRSSFAIRRISDQLCLENGLSVIEKPQPSKGRDYGEWLGERKPTTLRDRLRELIDASLHESKSFDAFIAAMKVTGVEVKRGKHLSFKMPDAKKFVRCNSLGVDYTEDAILERISGQRMIAPKQKTITPTISSRPNLLIDIQAKIHQGYSPGFERFAKIHNLKEAAKTLMFLQESGLMEYEALAEKTNAISKAFHETSARLKAVESRLAEISCLQKEIGAYSKTREVYRQYRDSGWNKKFYTAHESEIIIHKAAKKHFDSLGLTKLPSMQSLKQEYATLDAEKRKLYRGYRAEREEMNSLLRAKSNVDRLFDEPKKSRKDHERDML